MGVSQGRLNHLARGKAVGSDGAPVKLLQVLPCDLQEARLLPSKKAVCRDVVGWTHTRRMEGQQDGSVI